MKEITVSNIGITLLALVSEKSMGAYDMVGVLEKTNFERWLSVSASSIYAMVKILEKRNLILGTPMKQGNMPEKTVFSITARGKAVLQENLIRCLASEDAHNTAFDVAILFICHLPKDMVLTHLRQKISKLEQDIQMAERNQSIAEANPDIPFIGPMLIEHNRLLKIAELQLTIKLLLHIEKAENWQYFIANEI